MENLGTRHKSKLSFTFTVAFSAFLSAISLIACNSGENCSDYNPDAKYRLSSIQKNFGNFQKNSFNHYVHSDGYEFKLNFYSDTTYWESRIMGECIVGKAEVREFSLKSDFPVFYATITISPENLNVHIHGNNFYTLTDSSGIIDTDYNNSTSHLDSLEINGTIYKDIYEICSEKEDDESSCIFISEKNGLLKAKFNDGSEFSILNSASTKD